MTVTNDQAMFLYLVGGGIALALAIAVALWAAHGWAVGRARAEGRRAGRAGLDDDVCPYHDPELAQAWRAGRVDGVAEGGRRDG